jgi:hypothetical protein
MKILVIGFFLIFYTVSIIGIIIKMKNISSKNRGNKIKIELYDNEELSTNLKNFYMGRLSDKSVRSSVRYHNSLYKTNNDYEQYRNSIRKLELP